MSQILEQLDSTETKAMNAAKGIVVSFVIPALNEERWIGDCIDSIEQLKLPTTIGHIEVIVVDNESTDQTVELSRSKGAKVISCPPGNPSHARNIGASAANGDWLAFVDADCCLDANWLVDCSEAIVAHRAVATGSQVMPPSQSDSWVTNTLGQLNGCVSDPQPSKVRWLPTAGLLVMKEHFDAIDGFDEQLVTCEDCDLGYRLGERGDLLFVSSATLVHHGESKTLNEVLWREAWRTRGNMRLALSRPRDWKNWVSLLLPVAFVYFLLAGIVCGVSSLFGFGSLQLGMGLIAFGLSIPLAMVARKLRGAIGISKLAQQWVVMTTFLTGRALGLFWRFPRVER